MYKTVKKATFTLSIELLEDLEIYLADIEYEPLTIERLCEVIIKLINKEFIYLKN